MEPMTTRSLGATWPSAPRAEAGMMVGKPKAADAAAVDFRKVRREVFVVFCMASVSPSCRLATAFVSIPQIF
jgi:hypothetical protein